MAEGKGTRDRSESNDFPDSDLESHQDDASNPPGKPGRKKNPNSQAARRDQNRIAQREFRLRKQQRIRDLEARVEILSGGKDEALGEIRNILKDLMEENQTLRGLLRGLSTFIGEGAGGLLPRLGWDMADFNNFVNRSESDTAWESYQRRKKNQATQPTASGSQPPQAQKRPAEDDAIAARSKKPKGNEQEHDREHGQNGYSLLVPMSAPPTTGHFPPLPRPATEGGLFTDLMRSNNGSPMFMNASPTSNATSYGAAPSSATSNNFQASYTTPLTINAEQALPPLSFPSPASMQVQQPPRIAPQTNLASPDQAEDDEDPNKNEAYKLIHYHLDNYKRNSAYCLPSSLRPTLVQRTVPHESVIDRILHPELRDRMILLRGRFDLVECLLDYRTSVTIHGDDVLAHSNWEIGEKWLRQYGFLIDQPTLNITNRWRRERGESELRLSDIGPVEHTPGAP